MLYKPSNPSPYHEPIDISNGISFSCSSTGNIDTKCRITIDGKYRITSNIDNLKYDSKSGSYSLKKHFKYESPSPNCERLQKNGYYKESSIALYQKYNSASPICSKTNASAIIRSGNNYTWQIRLYDKNSFTPEQYSPTQWFAYGTVSEVINSSKGYTVLKIRPHRDIACVPTDEDYLKLKLDPQSNKTILKQMFCYYEDSNAKYYLLINGQFIEIIDYSYYNPLTSSPPSFNNYGDPTYGYIVIKTPQVSVLTSDEYNIYCNFIDSQEYYFYTASSPVINLYTLSGQQIPETMEYNNSKLIVNGTYHQSEGADVSYYKFTLYHRTRLGYEEIDSTGEVFSNQIHYEYDCLLPNQIYKLYCQITDSNNNTSMYYEDGITLKVLYDTNTIAFQAGVNYYPQRHSAIVDWSEVLSISGKTINNRYEYKNISNENNTLIVKEPDTLSPANACHIDFNNTIFYDEIDGTRIYNPDNINKGILPFINITGSFQFFIDTNKAGDLVSVRADDGCNYTLSWNTKYFICTLKDKLGVIRRFRYSPYWDANKDVYIKAKYEPSDIYMNPMPLYQWDDNETWDDNDIWYEETAASKYLWRIVFGQDEVFFKNVTLDTDYAKGVKFQ